MKINFIIFNESFNINRIIIENYLQNTYIIQIDLTFWKVVMGKG